MALRARQFKCRTWKKKEDSRFNCKNYITRRAFSHRTEDNRCHFYSWWRSDEVVDSGQCMLTNLGTRIGARRRERGRKKGYQNRPKLPVRLICRRSHVARWSPFGSSNVPLVSLSFCLSHLDQYKDGIYGVALATLFPTALTPTSNYRETSTLQLNSLKLGFTHKKKKVFTFLPFKKKLVTRKPLGGH